MFPIATASEAAPVILAWFIVISSPISRSIVTAALSCIKIVSHVFAYGQNCGYLQRRVRIRPN